LESHQFLRRHAGQVAIEPTPIRRGGSCPGRQRIDERAAGRRAKGALLSEETLRHHSHIFEVARIDLARVDLDSVKANKISSAQAALSRHGTREHFASFEFSAQKGSAA
jgi:hypothetical protein